MKNFYESLSDAIQSVPAHNFLAVLGDFNGRLVADNVPHSSPEDKLQWTAPHRSARGACTTSSQHAFPE